jgi:hypothetical protein
MSDSLRSLFDRIERLGIRLTVAPAVMGVMLGKSRRIFQKYLAEFDGSVMSVDRASKPPADKQRQASGMIDMAVAEDDGVYFLRFEGKWLAVEGFRFTAALHKAAVEKNRVSPCPENMAGAGHAPGRSVKFNFHVDRVWLYSHRHEPSMK